MDETQALSDDEHEAAKLLLDDQNEVQCRLVLVSDEPNVPKELLLSSGENHIGRAETGWDQGAPYHRIDHDKVSRRHAIIEPDPKAQELFVRDQNSRCGTTVTLQVGWQPIKSKKKDRPVMVPATGTVSFGPLKYKPTWGSTEAVTQAYDEPETQAYRRASTTPPGSPPATPRSSIAPVPATPAASSGDTVTTASGRVATVLERRSNDMLYVELDGNANGEGAAFERKNIRASTVTRGDPPEGETQADATGFLRATPDLHTQGTDASGFLPSPGGGGFDYGSPENDETQLDELPAVRDSATLFDLRAASWRRSDTAPP